MSIKLQSWKALLEETDDCAEKCWWECSSKCALILILIISVFIRTKILLSRTFPPNRVLDRIDPNDNVRHTLVRIKASNFGGSLYSLKKAYLTFFDLNGRYVTFTSHIKRIYHLYLHVCTNEIKLRIFINICTYITNTIM